MDIKKYLPLLQWLPHYKGRTFRHDLMAGLTVSLMLIPQGMAYAMLAGMPPIYGLYGGLIPLFLYGILGTSAQLSIGPVAISALLVLAGISQLAEPTSPEYISLVILTGLLIGVVQVSMGLMKMGFLVNFLSHPVIIGFTSAAAVIIAGSQLTYLLGFPIPRYKHFYDTIGYSLEHLNEIHWPAFALCIGGIILILLFRFINRSIPSGLIVIMIGIGIVSIFRLDEAGVNIVGDVPKGLPAFKMPSLKVDNIVAVLPTVFAVTIIGIVESIGIAKVLEDKKKNGKVRPNQELLALGISKVGGAFFQALPTSASLTRSAVNDDAGARTGMSSIITSLFVGLTLLFLTPLIYYLPEALLASIIFVAVASLFNIKEAIHLWYTHKQDFAMMMATFIFTLLLGIKMGVLIGVVLSLIMIIYRASKAHVAVLGRLPETTHYRNVKRFKEAKQTEGLLIMRFDAQLFFGNVEYFKKAISKLVSKYNGELDVFILDASCMEGIDSTGLKAIHDVIDYLNEKHIKFQLSGAIGPVRDLLFKTGLMQKIGQENQFMYLHDAEQAYIQKLKDGGYNWTANAIQTNLTDEK